MNMLVIILILLIILVALGMAAALMMGQEKDKKNKNLAVIKGQKQTIGSIEDEIADANRRRADIAKKLKESGEDQAKENEDKNKVTLRMTLERAGLSITPKQFILFSIIFGTAFTFLLKIIGMSTMVVLLGAVTGYLGIPRMFLNHRVKKRQKEFLEFMPDLLESMVRMLKAGMPVTEAISMAGKEFEGPIGEEMERIYEAQKIGVPLPDACMESARRMPLTEMQMFATGIAIQSQTGSSLSDILLNLSNVIRGRFSLRRKVKALSSEAKSSAGIIGALPFLIGGGLYLLRPDYVGLLFTTTTGKIMVVGGLCWMSIGIIIMKIMINFKI
jgi:tight adherence protein B